MEKKGARFLAGGNKFSSQHSGETLSFPDLLLHLLPHDQSDGWFANNKAMYKQMGSASGYRS